MRYLIFQLLKVNLKFVYVCANYVTPRGNLSRSGAAFTQKRKTDLQHDFFFDMLETSLKPANFDLYRSLVLFASSMATTSKLIWKFVRNLNFKSKWFRNGAFAIHRILDEDENLTNKAKFGWRIKIKDV